MRITDKAEFFKFIETLDAKEKHQLLTEAVGHLFNTIGANDILTIKEKKWFFQDRELDENQVHQLVEEMTFFKKSKLWQVLKADLRYQANKRMFIDSRTIDDLVAGKLILFYIDIIETRLNKIK